jgi:hypothetical protein
MSHSGKNGLFMERARNLSKTYVLRLPFEILMIFFLYNAHGWIYQAVSILLVVAVVIETGVMIACYKKNR